LAERSKHASCGGVSSRVFGNSVVMRAAEEIRHEIDELSARRTDAWHRLSAGDRSSREEIACLTERMDELWLELRETTLARRHGPRERIIKRARAQEKFERQFRRTSRAHVRPTRRGTR
jgi:hypothetical protein